MAQLDVSQDYLTREIERQSREIERRRLLYRKSRAPIGVSGCTAIVVDDGIATGATMRAALRVLRRQGPARLILAVPVAPPSSLHSLRAEADQTICLASPEPFDAISVFYEEFHQLRDEEVTNLLARAARRQVPPSGAPKR